MGRVPATAAGEPKTPISPPGATAEAEAKAARKTKPTAAPKTASPGAGDPNRAADRPNKGDEQAAAAKDVTEGFKLGEDAPTDLFAVMNAEGVEDAFSTEPPERGHQLAFKGRMVDLSTIHEIGHVKDRQAAD